VDTNIFFDISRLKSFGKNSIIGKTVRIRKPELVEIGDNVIIDDYTYISGAVSIGDYVHIGAGCVLSASQSRIQMGAFSGLSAGCKVYAGSSNYLSCALDLPTIPSEHVYGVQLSPVRIDAFGLLGASCIVLPGSTIPEGAAVAASLKVSARTTLAAWHLLVDETGKLIRRRGVAELQRRVRAFYEMEFENEQ
jgi:acetyltransferase-like isoleucine patch superfamily enzyme